MILVDTSIWIDHLHRAEPQLARLLVLDQIGAHPLVIEELALGSLRNRVTVLELIGALRTFPVLAHDELLTFVDAARLWGRGLTTIDAHLLGAVRLQPSGVLWTRDKRLLATATEVGVATMR